MRNFVTVTLLLLFSVHVSAQDELGKSFVEKSFDATYKVEYVIKESDTVISEKDLNDKRKKIFAMRYNQRLRRVTQLIKNLEFNLKFNVKNSVFEVIEYIAENPRDATYLEVLLKYKGSYYSYNNKNLQAKNSFGQNFLVEYPKFDWTITNESKKIGNYNCYKAILTRHVKNARGNFEYKVTAWFAPELPFNFGPKEYNGLPGLIVELNEGGKIIFRLHKINQIENLDIKLPRKNKEISLKDFDILSEEMFTSLRNKN